MTSHTPTIIDGKAIARDLRGKMKLRVAELRERGITPKLDVILIGDHAPSRIYVQNKKRAANEIGMDSVIHQLPADSSEQTVLDLIHNLNAAGTHGILLQLPVPDHLNSLRLLDAIHPERDVDGLNIANVGKRTLGLPGILPCTPKGCLALLKSVQNDLSGLHAVVIGRSDLVGKPMAQLLLRENCTVTQAHSRTQNLADLCRQADILIAAIGSPRFVKGEWIKDGAIVIDVGINRVEDGSKKLVGDVDFDSAINHVRAITPVPGGVGPMTIAMLLSNTLDAAENGKA